MGNEGMIHAMDIRHTLSVTVLIPALVIVGVYCMANGQSNREERPAAPDFPASASWINTERPLTMHDLRGRVVLLDFWTYCCINCMHVLPDLARLEKKYEDRLVVVGVHSAKFDAERDTGNIRRAVERYGIRHPVINDAGMVMWHRLGVNSWPTIVLIDPNGGLVGKVSGEGNFDILDRAVSDLITRQTGSPQELSPLPLTDSAKEEPETFLRFPGKVLADSALGRLFVADSGHNRIIVARLDDGDILSVIGSGETGLRDGGYSTAAFSNPQGMARDGGILYVADTDNHAIRAVDLASRTVRTVAGTGNQARYGARGGPAETSPLNSPWDLIWHDGGLYIAMAGSHQLWRYDPERRTVEVHAGSGAEDIIDGPLSGAALAQPSGITGDERGLFFADSETSSIRKISGGRVTTLIGKGLFEFGSSDGSFRAALLQHPLGVAYDNGLLWIADTYNNRLRRIDLTRSVIETAAGSDRDGFEDGPGDLARFDEPGGVTVSGGKVYVADTNNHAVRVFDPRTREVSTFELVETVAVPEGIDSFQVLVLPPEGYHLNTEGPSFLNVSLPGGNRVREKTQNVRPEELRVSVRCDKGNGLFEFTGDIYLCRSGDRSICTMTSVRFIRRLRSEKNLSGDAVVTFTIPKGKEDPAPDIK